MLVPDVGRSASVGCEPGSCSVVQVFVVPGSLVGTVGRPVLVASMPEGSFAVAVEKKELAKERLCSPESKGESRSRKLVIRVGSFGSQSRCILEWLVVVPRRVVQKNPKLFGFV